MKQWWNEKDLLHIIPEVSLDEKLSLNQVVEKIYEDVVN